MDLRRSDLDGLNRLAGIWKTTPGAEFEAMLTGLDLVGWQDVIQYLRSLGMRENPQLVKMNICLSNDIRITLEGAGVIQAYCRDNRISDKPFVAMLKEAITDAEPVTLGAYGAKAKLKREIPLAADDARVKEALARWDQLGKHFRNIQRFEFVAPGGIPVRFDVSIVRENAGKPARTFQEARVTTQPPKYEVEVELTAPRSATPDKAVQHIIRGLSWLLQGRQRSFVLVSNQAADYVRDSISGIFSGSNRNRNGNRGRPAFKFPGPQPATLERKNIVEAAEPGIPNLRSMPGGYNVTDKADGLRCLLFVSDNGRVFLIDGGARVYATGKQVDPKDTAGLVLDGEWIRRNRKGHTVSHYYAFDILASAAKGSGGGDTSVAGLPFMVAGAMLGSAASANTRQAVMASFVGILGSASQSVRGVPSTDNLQIGMKTFRASLGADIFQAGAAATLEDAKSAPYNTDGLIFTPNSAPLPLGRGTWPEQLKWKPPHENTIDFLVIVDRERDAKGQPTAAEAIGTKYREDSGQTVRYKTLRLFVGSNRDGAFADPRITVLGDGPLPRSLDEGEWREVEFRPVDPRDPMASLCYVAIDAGSADPAAATAAATALDAGDLIRTTRTGDIIQSDMIVEMAYHPERAPGWRWEPTRVRHDKTERWLAQQGGGGRKGGTMNADWVANSIWNSLHNPVDEDAIRSGRVSNCASPAALSAAGSRRTNGRDQMVVQCMRNFHDYVKRSTLLRKSVMPAGANICDLAMSNGVDLGKWVAADVNFVFGCDVQAAAINSPEDGAYRRLLDKMVELGGRENVPVMAFAQADAARRLLTGEAAMTPEDAGVLQGAVGPTSPAPDGFDLVSCMFAMHYMFRDEATLTGFLTNLADLVKVGGYFVGCGKDGDSVARLLAGPEQSVMGGNAWMMTKRYGSGIGASVPPSAAGVGLAVEVDNIAAGEVVTEYLVSWPYLQARLAECGLELLTAEEITTLGLPASTQMFAETWATAEAGGDLFAMTDAIKRLSFMNRWFIFKRRSDRRPAPLGAGVAIAPPAVTEVRQIVSEVAPADVIDLGEPAPAPAPADVIELGPAPADVIEMAESPAPLLINAANKEPDQRLGADLADWPRYMTLGTQVEITDLDDPTVKYPSVEAAIAAAKYQKAVVEADKKLLGASLFRVEGAIHQKFSKEREKLTATGAPPEALAKSVDDEVAMVRVASGKGKMKAYKATWDEGAWTSQRAAVYQAYLAQRFVTDARFKAMVEAAKASGGEIMFVNGVDPSYLGVGVRIDGSIAGGENMIGKWMQQLA